MKSRALIEQLLQEDTYKFSSTQIDLPKALADYVIKWGREMVPDSDLYYDDKGNLGRESESHITVLYGLTDKEPPKALLDILRKTPPFTVRLTGVSLFDNNPDYDVLKFDVESEELEALSNAIRQACPNENKFPKYHGHCTIAYVKKDRCKDVAGLYPFHNEPPVPPDFEVYQIVFKPAGDSGDPNRKPVRRQGHPSGCPAHLGPAPPIGHQGSALDSAGGPAAPRQALVRPYAVSCAINYAIWRCSTHDAGLTEDGLCPVAGFPITGTGYFGIPGGFGGVVHATRDGKPICGQHLDPRAKYQWCCHEFDPRILECKKCERIIANHYEKAHNLLVALGPVSRSVCPSARARSGIPAAKKPK